MKALAYSSMAPTAQSPFFQFPPCGRPGHVVSHCYLNRLASLPQGMTRIFGGYFFMPKVKYTKPYQSIEQQIALLKSRGLVIDVDADVAKRFLANVNYYRFTGYALPFLASREQFRAGSKFSYIRDVYRFDRRLRDFMSDALEAVELSFRALFARQFTKAHGALGYLDPLSFPPANIQHHKTVTEKFKEEFNRSDEVCAKHFRNTYDDPPLWAIVEVVSFGALVRLYRISSKADQNNISSLYGFRGDILASYLQHLVVVRNLCAHHSRMYDRRFSYKFPMPLAWRSIHGVDTAMLFSQFALIYRMLAPTDSSVFDRDVWRSNLCKFLKKIPKNPICDHSQRAGIPSSPLKSPLW